MAYKGAPDAAYVLVGAVNIAPAMESLNIRTSAVLDERRFLGTAWPSQLDTGTRRAELTMAGVLDSPTTDGVAAIDATGMVVSALLAGNAVDMPFHGFQNAKISGLELGIEPDKVDELTPQFTISGEVNYGTVVAPWANRTTDGNTDTTYSTRPAAVGIAGHAYLHVTAYTGGATKVVVKLRTSAGHVTFADIGTFADVTAIGAWVLAIPTAIILEHLSISWAWTGGTGPTWSGFVGVAVD